MKIIFEFDSFAEAAPVLEAYGAMIGVKTEAKARKPKDPAPANPDAPAPATPSVPVTTTTAPASAAPNTAIPAPVANEAELRDKVGELTIKVRDTKGRAVAVDVLMKHLPPGTEKPRARDIKAENLVAAIADLEKALQS